MNYTELTKDGGLPFWWHWKNFTPKEVSCKCCGEIWDDKFGTVPPLWFFEAMDTLQLLRTQWGKPLIINSGHRCKKHNAEVGGVSNSQHYTHIAFDLQCRDDEEQKKLAWIAENAGFRFIKLYPGRGFIHCDLRIGK